MNSMSDTPLLRVKSVNVQKLFGLYDHTIPLRLDERVTIIHGPNGVGKTVVLKLLAALFAGRLHEFGRVPFERFQVELTDGTVISLESNISKQARVQLTVSVPGQPLRSATLAGRFNPAQLVRVWELPFARLARMPSARSYVVPRVEATKPEESGHHIFSAKELRIEEVAVEEPDWFPPIRKQVSVHLIETQRLLRLARSESESESIDPETMSMVPTVSDYAKDLQRRVTEALARYASVSQALDQSFPRRLLRAQTPALSIADIKARMTALDEKRANLKSIGLLDDTAAYPFDVASLDELDSAQRSVMTLYVHDTTQKLDELDDLLRRIELLRDNVNNKFRHKSIKFDRENGFTAMGSDGRPLDLNSLSSGEQHELVLLYDLLFRVQPNTLVLIDEPELSLHVRWQKRFLPDLLEIVDTARFDALVATHSPFIVGSHHNLMVPLSSEDE